MSSPLLHCRDCRSIVLPQRSEHPLVSPLGNAFDTNYIPSNYEARLVQTAIEDLSRDINEFDEHILRLSDYRNSLQRRRDGYRYIVSRLAQLPPEILGLILNMVTNYRARDHYDPAEEFGAWSFRCPDDLPGHISTRLFNPMVIPLQLSAVCRRWRAVALPMSSLWTSVVHHIDDIRNPYAWAEVSNAAVMRSGQQRLDVHIELLNSERGPLVVDSYPVVDTLVRTSERWKSLKLFYSPEVYPSICSTTFASLAGRLPELKSLTLGFDVVAPDLFVTVFKEAPKLRTVTLFGVHPMITEFPFPWAQLDDLSIFMLDFSEGIDIFHKCKNLSRFRWEVNADDFDGQYGPERLREAHNSLTSLQLDFTHDAPLTDKTFEKLQLPRLRDLTITARYFAREAHGSEDEDEDEDDGEEDDDVEEDDDDDEGDDDKGNQPFLFNFQPFSRLISFSPRLEKLSLEYMALPPGYTHEILSLVSDVSALSLCEGEHTLYIGILHALAAAVDIGGSKVPSLLPRLEQLDYKFKSDRYVEIFASVTALIHNRWVKASDDGTGRGLQRVTIHAEQVTGDLGAVPGYADLMKLRDDGFDVKVIVHRGCRVHV